MARPGQRLFAIAEEQWGLVTRRQATEADIAPRSLARLIEDGRVERVAHGVYRVRGAGEPDYLGLRAAWLQLDPGRPAWARLDDLDVAVISHASAADLYGVGDLRADVHEFTLPVRRQSRREVVRLHRGTVPQEQRTLLHGLPVTRAGRMVGDLLADHVDPGAVAHIMAQAVNRGFDSPTVIAKRIAPYAASFGFRRDDGAALLDHLLALAGYKDRSQVMAEIASG
jgi:predicted transcriptional regulator of viral defense system